MALLSLMAGGAGLCDHTAHSPLAQKLFGPILIQSESQVDISQISFPIILMRTDGWQRAQIGAVPGKKA